MGICNSKNDYIDVSISQNILSKLEKNICKVYQINNTIKTGFFCKIPYLINSQLIPVLITNKLIINKENSEMDKTIKISFNDINDNIIEKNIELRLIFINEEKDINIIEIIPNSDEINLTNFIEIDENIFQNNESYESYKDKTIYLLGYPNVHFPSYSLGTIKEINDNNFKYLLCNNENDLYTSMSPILSLSNNKIIGVNKGNNEGIFIKYIIEELNEIENNKIISLYLNNNKLNKDNINMIEMIIENDDENEIDEDNNIFRICNHIENSINIEGINNTKKKYVELYFNDNLYHYKKFSKIEKGIFNLKIIINGLMTDCRNLFVFCCKNLISVNLSSFNSKNVTNMSYMFGNCEKLEYINFTNFDTKNVTTMNRMFMDCKNIKYLNLSSFDTKNVKKMNYMFHGCENLLNLDLSKFNTINVKEMSDMFHGCKSLKNLDLSNFNTSKVNNMSRMFMDCNNLVNINLSNFNTTNVTNISRMFMNCKNLQNLDLSFFDTQNVMDMNRIFFDCTNLKSINLSFFQTKEDTNINFIFNGCKNLKEIYINKKIDFNNIKNQLKMEEGINAKLIYI